MRKILMTLTLVLIVLLGFGCKEASFNLEGNKLVVGLECDYAPFNWAEVKESETNVKVNNSNYYAEGYDIQIAKLIAQDLGYELVVEMIPFDGLIAALNVGKIDCIIAGMSPTEKRKQSISFSNPYYSSKHVLLMKSDSVYADAKTFADLDDATVIGQANTTYDKLAKQISEKNTNAKYSNPLKTVPEIIYAISSGIVDVTILEEPVAKGVLASEEGYTYIELHDEFDLEEADTVVSIGIRKNDTQLLDMINQALAKIDEETRNNLIEQALQG